MDISNGITNPNRRKLQACELTARPNNLKVNVENASTTNTLSTYTSTKLLWRGNGDFRFTASVPANSSLCGVKLGSNNWETNGVTSLWMKWCDKTNWSTQTDGRLWQNQPALDFGGSGRINMTFGDSDCDTNEDCAGNLVCI